MALVMSVIDLQWIWILLVFCTARERHLLRTVEWLRFSLQTSCNSWPLSVGKNDVDIIIMQLVVFFTIEITKSSLLF